MYSIRFIGPAVLLGLAIGGCTTTPELDSRFGHAVNAAKAQQTINPDASRNTDPVAGLDGIAAKESIDRYQNTFREPAPAFEVFGGTGGSGR